MRAWRQPAPRIGQGVRGPDAAVLLVGLLARVQQRILRRDAPGITADQVHTLGSRRVSLLIGLRQKSARASLSVAAGCRRELV